LIVVFFWDIILRVFYRFHVFSMAENQSGLGAENTQHAPGSPDQDDVETEFQPEQAPSTAASNVLLQLQSLFADRGLMPNVYKPVTALTQANGNILKAGGNVQHTVEPFDENTTILEPGDYEKQVGNSEDRRSDDNILAEMITILESNRILEGLGSTAVEKDQVPKEVAKSSKVSVSNPIEKKEY
jgi:hypothetical protein